MLAPIPLVDLRDLSEGRGMRVCTSVLLPGFIVSAIIAAAASFLSEHYKAPVMLFALLLGMRITFSQIAALGWHPVVLVVVAVAVTITLSMLAARAMGFQTLFGLLTGGATAICGASAAMALAAALPAHPGKERATMFTVIGVSALSTLAMIAYPMIVNALGLNATQSGVFLGGTIHDVAQVVGAGYGMSQVTGNVATVVKLMRVAMLLPVIICAVLISRAQGASQEGSRRPPLLPWFAVTFIVFAAINSTGWVPVAIQKAGNALSQWCLVIAISALGMKTQIKELASVGIKPVVLMVGEAVFLAGLVLAMMRLGF